MKREEQIKNYAINNCVQDDIDDTSYELIIETAEWADNTMLEKICKWLENINPDDYMDSGIFQIHTLIGNLRKAMEE